MPLRINTIAKDNQMQFDSATAVHFTLLLLPSDYRAKRTNFIKLKWMH